MQSLLDSRIVHQKDRAEHVHSLLCHMPLEGAQMPQSLAVFTAHDSSEKSLFEKNLDLWKIPYEVLRLSSPWSHTLRLRNFSEHLKSLDCTYVLYGDAFDVALSGPISEIFEKYTESRSSLLFCSSTVIRGYYHMMPVLEWAEREHPGRYLNAGSWIGKREVAIEFIEAALEFVTDEDPHASEFLSNEVNWIGNFPKSTGCDQTIFRWLEPRFSAVKVDSEQRVFSRN